MTPLPVKVSTVLSLISNVGKLLATILPQNTSEITGAVEKTITLSYVIPKPEDGVELFCGC